MALGSKLGGVFGAIGSGLSFIPGPWSALGAAFGIAGQAAQTADQIKQQKEAQRAEEEAQKQAQKQQLEQTIPGQDPSRPEQGQLPTQDNSQVSMPKQNIYQPKTDQQGMYSGQQVSPEIANLILGGDIRDMRGP